MKEDHQKVHQKLHEKHKDHSFGGHGMKLEIHRGDIILVALGMIWKSRMHWRGNVDGVKCVNHFQREGDGLGSNNAEANIFLPDHAPATPPQVSWEQIQSVDMADIDRAYNKNFIQGGIRAVRPRVKKQENKQGLSPTARSEKLVLLVRISGVQLHKGDA